MKVEKSYFIYYRFSIKKNRKEIARAFLFLINNDLHDEPYGLVEDVFVDESCRGEGRGTKIVKAVIAKARELRCYKLIATSRFGRSKVHKIYLGLGFKKHGTEFRMELK